ncbi:MAG: hypothetical protein QGI86_26290 [Candidatus Poribacteria bacterium]|nr:hypothetical protein [Candidatus Poribacteria bacterium]
MSRKKEASDGKGVPTGDTDTRLITPYTSFFGPGFSKIFSANTWFSFTNRY